MSNHLLHGSVNEIYRTLVNDIPQGWSKSIPTSTEALLAYGPHGDPDHYSLMPLETPEGTKLLFSRCSRKRNAKAPSYYVHKQLLDVDMNTLYSDFDQLLHTTFCSEAEFDRIAQDPARRMQPDIHWSGSPVEINPTILYGILRAMICRWRNGSDPVIVRVPEMSAEEYNAYTFGAVSTIYSCLPAAIRGKVGFMTYSSPVKQLNSVGLFFLPESQTSKGIYLDRESDQSRQLMNGYLDESMEEMIKRIAFEPEHRQEELQNLWNAVESRMALEEIREKDYIEYLEFVPLYHLKVENLEQRTQLQELLRNHVYQGKLVPEYICKDLRAVYGSKITPEDLDTDILNRMQSDTDFEIYLRRVDKWNLLCTCSEALKRHTLEKIQSVFEGYLAEATKAEDLTRMEELLTELSQKPAEIFPDIEIDDCSRKWLVHAEPVYEAWIEEKLSGIEKQMNKIINEKAPEDAKLEQIIGNSPEDIYGEFRTLQRSFYGVLEKLPKRLVDAKENYRQTYEDRIKEVAQRSGKELAKRYNQAAKQALTEALQVCDRALWKRIDAIRNNLKKLLEKFPDMDLASSQSVLKEFDENVKDGVSNRARDLVQLAERKLDALGLNALNEPDVVSQYQKLSELRSALKEHLGNLKVDINEWYKPFSDKSEERFQEKLKYWCTRQPTGWEDDRKEEENRLSNLLVFLAKNYPRESDLKKGVQSLLNKVKQSSKGPRKRGSAASGSTNSARIPPKSQKETKQQTQRKHTPSDQEPPDVEEEQISVLGVMGQAPQIIAVEGKSLRKILEELREGEQASQRVTLSDGSAAIPYDRAELKETLEWLAAPNGVAVPLDIAMEVLGNLQEQFSAAALTPEEKVSILAALTKNVQFISIGKKLVDQVIGSPENWNSDKKNQKEIRRLLRRSPEYAAAHPSWLKQSLKARVKDFFGGSRESVEASGAYQKKESYSPEEVAKLKRELLLTRCSAVLMLTAVVALILCMCFLKPAAGTYVPETTIPTDSVLDTTAPDESVPETTDPDESVPEATDPDESVPETTDPDESVPETTDPAESIPETTAPDESIPETTAPDESTQNGDSEGDGGAGFDRPPTPVGG